jgi:RHS repeat-associated protein
MSSSASVVGRQAHLPFGDDFAQSGTQDKHHFTSYERDSESGLDYALNRQMVSSTARFHQADPYPGSIRQPQSLNRYTYTHNDPVNRIDPLGLWPIIILPPAFWPGPIRLSTTESHYPGTVLGGGGSGGGSGGLGGDPFALDNPGADLEQLPIDLGFLERLAEILENLTTAISLAQTALQGRPGCAELFGGLPQDTSPSALLTSLLGPLMGAPNTMGSFGFADLGPSAPGGVTSARMIPILGSRTETRPDGTTQTISTFVGANIFINVNPASPFVSPRGYDGRYGASNEINRAITVIHELGHVVALLYGSHSTQIVEDRDDATKSAQNSQLIYDQCFK